MRPPPPPVNWTAAEVEAGRKECSRQLSGLHVLFEPVDPIREGACGLPAPIRLKGEQSLGLALVLSPAPVISCKLAEAVGRWIGSVVQPAAQTHLHEPVVSISTLSAYNCRTRYDDPAQRMSEHAYANAIDVSEFVTAKGLRISLLNDWTESGERSAFLHGIHAGACRIFGTSLGPDANGSHKNHIHLDMKERQRPLCDFTPEQLRASEEAKSNPPLPQNTGTKLPASSGGKL